MELFLKRKRDEYESSDDSEGPPNKREAQVWVLSIRFSFSKKNYPDGDIKDNIEHFKQRHVELCERFKSLIGKKGAFLFQLEKTDKAGQEYPNYHYQGYLKLTDKRRPRTVGGVLGGHFPGIEVQACSSAGQEALKNYVIKQDNTYVAGPWSDKPIPPVYKGSDLPQKFYSWQQHILDDIATKPDDRTIHWLYDQEGKIGKSKLAKYLVFKKLACFMSFQSSTDLAHQVLQAGPEHAYVFDLPRTKSDKIGMNEIYTMLESIKNGLVLSGKYNG